MREEILQWLHSDILLTQSWSQDSWKEDMEHRLNWMGKWMIRWLNIRILSISLEFWKGNNFPFLVHIPHLLPVRHSAFWHNSGTPVSRAKDHCSQMRSERWLVNILFFSNTWSSSVGMRQRAEWLSNKQQFLHVNEFKWKAEFGVPGVDVVVRWGKRGKAVMDRMRHLE